MICDDLKKIVGDVYELEDYIIDRLECSYKKLIGKKGKAKYIPIDNDDELLETICEHQQHGYIVLHDKSIETLCIQCGIKEPSSALIKIGYYY